MKQGLLVVILVLATEVGLLGQTRQAEVGVRPPEARTPSVEPTTWTTTAPTVVIPLIFGRKSNEKSLAETGPIFAPLFNMSEFDIIAFAKGDWPAVLDYELAPGTVGFLMVFSDGVDPFYYRLAGPGRQLQTLTLPPRFGPRPKISRYSMRVWQDQTGVVAPASFSVYGIGAGPRAVGSVNIDQLRFAPAVVRVGQEKAEYGFRARKPFDRVEANFVRVGRVRADGPIYAQNVAAKEDKNVKQEVPFSDTWDGKPGKEFKPLDKQDHAEGQFKLHVRAWLKNEKEGDWLAAWSEDIVQIQRPSGK